MTDSYRHKGQRRRLVEDLRKKGISDEAILAAMGAIPRHFFFQKDFEEHAYEDKAFPIGNEQTISQPYTVAYQTTLLNVKNGDRVLEIGTGSGYQAAVLAALGAQVYTIERQEALYLRAQKLLSDLGFVSVRCFFGDGARGLPHFAPFDKIIVTAGAPVVPDKLKMQLRHPGGVLVVPVGDTVQRMFRIVRTGAETWQEEGYDTFRFVPFLEGTVRNNDER